MSASNETEMMHLLRGISQGQNSLQQEFTAVKQDFSEMKGALTTLTQRVEDNINAVDKRFTDMQAQIDQLRDMINTAESTQADSDGPHSETPHPELLKNGKKRVMSNPPSRASTRSLGSIPTRPTRASSTQRTAATARPVGNKDAATLRLSTFPKRMRPEDLKQAVKEILLRMTKGPVDHIIIRPVEKLANEAHLIFPDSSEAADFLTTFRGDKELHLADDSTKLYLSRALFGRAKLLSIATSKAVRTLHTMKSDGKLPAAAAIESCRSTGSLYVNCDVVAKVMVHTDRYDSNNPPAIKYKEAWETYSMPKDVFEDIFNSLFHD